MKDFKYREKFDLKEGGEILVKEMKRRKANPIKSFKKEWTIKKAVQSIKSNEQYRDERELVYEDVKEVEIKAAAFFGKFSKKTSQKAFKNAKEKFKKQRNISNIIEKFKGKAKSGSILEKVKFQKRAMSIKGTVIKYIVAGICAMALFICLFISIIGGSSSAITITAGQDNITSSYLYLGQLEVKKGYITGSGMTIDAEPLMAYIISEFGMQKTFDDKQKMQLTKVYNQINAKGYRKKTEDFFHRFSDSVFSSKAKYTAFQKLISEGIYTQYKTLGTPFVGKNWTDKITSSWGWRGHPISGGIKIHRGLDIGMPSGTPVNSVCSGKVSSSGWNGSYGNCVMVRCQSGDTDITVLYAHLSSISVKKGSNVRQGSIIGKVGSTGNSTGPHLHIEVMSGGYSSDITKLFYPRIYLKETKE